MGDNSDMMELLMRTPKIFLTTKHAIYPLITSDNSTRKEVRKGTVFAANLSAESNESYTALILAINPCNQGDNNPNYFTRLPGMPNTERVSFRRLESNLNVNLLVCKPTDRLKSRLRKTLKLETSADDRVGLKKIYVVKNTGSSPKKFQVEKDENGREYRLKDTERFTNNNVLPVGAPVFNCNKRFLRKSVKKLFGMVTSVETNGTLSVLEFTADCIKEIINGSSSMAGMELQNQTDGKSNSESPGLNKGMQQQGPPADLQPQELPRIARGIANIWKEVALRTKKFDEDDIDNITCAKFDEDPSSKALTMLMRYKQRGGTRATLAEAIKEDKEPLSKKVQRGYFIDGDHVDIN